MSQVFTSFKIKQLTLANRLVLPPMALDQATEHGEVTRKLLDHYLLRVRSNPEKNFEAETFRARVGMIIVEHAYVCASGRAHSCQLGIDEDVLISGLQLLVKEIHKEGVPVGIQLSHAGARALNYPVGPSKISCPYLVRYGKDQATVLKESPRELSKGEIRQIVLKFAKAAERARKAGFDFLEIHGAHGYLLNQFYSPLTNQRSDEYGGNLERRLKFPLEVITAVKDVVGSAMPVFYRLGADDRIPGGNTVKDSIQAIPFFKEAGIDCLDLSGGLTGYPRKGPQGFFNYLAEALKAVTDIPILVTGGITDIKMAESLIKTGTTDLVGIGRALLADPQWVAKAWQKLRQSECEN
jgi:NADPH2 dehydrogenase